MKGLTYFAVIGFLCISFQASAATEVKNLDSTVKVDGKTLTLNGQGIRKATIFNVEVYRAGLYLENKSGDAQQILKSDQTKRVTMDFLRDVEAKKIREAWEKGFEKHCEPDCDKLRDKLKTVQSQMADMKKGDRLVFTFYPNKTVATVNGKEQPAIEGDRFGDILLATWLGDRTELEDLRKDLLAQK